MNYRIVTAGFPEDLTQLVNQLLDQGWRTAGGVSVSMTPNHDLVWSQAVTKEY